MVSGSVLTPGHRELTTQSSCLHTQWEREVVGTSYHGWDGITSSPAPSHCE
jgi:hypothetical protein